MIAVLAIISKKSRERNRTIAATTLNEIKKELVKYYNIDITERHILNIIQNLKNFVVKERDPSNHRRSIYRINPKVVEEVTVTIIKLDNADTQNTNIEGILYSPLAKLEKKFLVIDNS